MSLGMVRACALAALIGGIAAACSDDQVSDASRTVQTDSADVRISTSVISSDAPVCDLSEALRIGSLDGESGVPLFGVNGIAPLPDGRLAVLNRGTSQILVVSDAGELLHEFGREGDGPSEFKELWSIHVRPPDTLIVGDLRPWRFTFFSPEGDFIRRVNLTPAEIERPDFALPLTSGRGFMMEEPSYEVGVDMEDRVVPVHLYTEAGDSSGSLGDFWLDEFGYLSREIRYVGNPVFGARARFAVLPEGRVLYATGRHEQLEVWGADDGLERIVRWEARSREVEAGAADLWRQQQWAAIEERFEITPEMEPIIEGQYGSHVPVSDVYPGHDQVIAAPDGSVWVQEYRRPADEGPGRWFSFDPSGVLQCVANVSPEVFPLAAAGYRVFALTRDELDVEYIIVYQVAAPRAPSES